MASTVAAPMGLAAAAVGLTLYNRGLFQAAWAAMKGAPLPLGYNKALTANPPPSVPTPVQPPIVGTGAGGGPISGSPPTSGDALQAAIDREKATRTPADWLNWCLQFVDDIRASLNQRVSTGPNGRAATAHDACAENTLTPGIAPRGDSVCFAGDPGHIGIALGGCQYVSAGLSGGVQVQDYCGGGNYIGHYAP